MKIDDWNNRISVISERFYNDIVSATSSGPFDGGCLIVAEALQRVIGGSIVVLTRADGRADHAAVEQGGFLWDFDGPLPVDDFLRQFNSNELSSCTGYREYQEGDLPNACCDNELSMRLTSLFESVLSDYNEIGQFRIK